MFQVLCIVKEYYKTIYIESNNLHLTVSTSHLQKFNA